MPPAVLAQEVWHCGKDAAIRRESDLVQPFLMLKELNRESDMQAHLHILGDLVRLRGTTSGALLL